MTDQEHIVILRAEIKPLNLASARRERHYQRLLKEIIEADKVSQQAVSSLEAAMQQLVSRHVQ